MSRYWSARLRGGVWAVGLSLVAGTALAVPIIDTRPQMGMVGYIGENAGTNAYGQTFAPTGPETSLDSFTIYVNDVFSTGSSGLVSFQGFLYGWDGTQTFGDALYESETLTTAGEDHFEEFTFNTGGLGLVEGQDYIFFVTGVMAGMPGQAELGTANADVYAGGGLYFSSNAAGGPWLDFRGQDLTFVATFSEPVPEPGTLFLLGAGLLVVGYARRWVA